jgi:hypothetical protein
METLYSSETSLLTTAALRSIPEDTILLSTYYHTVKNLGKIINEVQVFEVADSIALCNLSVLQYIFMTSASEGVLSLLPPPTTLVFTVHDKSDLSKPVVKFSKKKNP